MRKLRFTDEQILPRDARRTISAYQHEFCIAHLRSALGDRSPAEFAAAFTKTDHPIPSLTLLSDLRFGEHRGVPRI